MAWRTTEDAVRELLETDDSINIEPFIDAANAVTDYIVSQDSDGILSSALKVQIEKYLAAHFYALKDPQYSSKSTGGASGSFIRAQAGQGFKATDWGQQAVDMDITGTLGKRRVSANWLGKAPSEQTDYVDRD